MHTKLAPFFTAVGMRLLSTLLVRQPCVYDVAALGTIANRWIRDLVIEIRAGLRRHLDWLPIGRICVSVDCEINHNLFEIDQPV